MEIITRSHSLDQGSLIMQFNLMINEINFYISSLKVMHSIEFIGDGLLFILNCITTLF